MQLEHFSSLAQLFVASSQTLILAGAKEHTPMRKLGSTKQGGTV